MQSCIKVEKLISILINHANVEISRDCVLYSTYIKKVILFLIMFLSVSEIETFNEFVHSTRPQENCLLSMFFFLFY